MVPVQNQLRSLARYKLGDVRRVSELAEITVHKLWERHGEDAGNMPWRRVLVRAVWEARDLASGGSLWRIKHTVPLALGSLEGDLYGNGLTDPKRYDKVYEQQLLLDLVEHRIEEDHMPLSIKARRQQGLLEIAHLIQDFEAWQKTATLPQYTTQVESLSTEVLTCARRLKTALDNLSAIAVGTAYSDCSKIEKQIAWLWRAWDFFREKFDQRENPRFGDTLRAADEVVWSCYRPFFQQPFEERVAEPAPLPYIEMEYSPVAVRRDEATVIGGRPSQQELLAAAFQKLPIPILKLPISAIENPWLIALVAHEAGHFLQRMISAKPLEFVEAFRKALEKGAGDASWGAWGIEIFADWYSVLMLGQWALHPIAQFAAGSLEDNIKPGGKYPPLLARLRLMAVLADFYGFAGTTTLNHIGLEEPKPGDFPAYDLIGGAVSKVASTIEQLAECQEIVNRVDCRPENFLPGGLVTQWSGYIARDDAQPQIGKPDSARLAAAGAVQTWEEQVFTPEEPPAAADLEPFRKAARKAMTEAKMPGVRASSAESTPAGLEPGAVLSDFLEEVSRE